MRWGRFGTEASIRSRAIISLNIGLMVVAGFINPYVTCAENRGY